MLISSTHLRIQTFSSHGLTYKQRTRSTRLSASYGGPSPTSIRQGHVRDDAVLTAQRRSTVWRLYRMAWSCIYHEALLDIAGAAAMEALQPYGHSLGLAAALLIAYFVLVCIRERIVWRHRSQGHPLPPGPRPLPILGNLLDMPRYKQWVGFRDLCARHGKYVDPTRRPISDLPQARSCIWISWAGPCSLSAVNEQQQRS